MSRICNSSKETLKSTPPIWWVSSSHHSIYPSLKGLWNKANQWEEEKHESSFSVPLTRNVLGRHSEKHSGPIWFDKMFSAHCAQGQWLHKAEGNREYDSWIVNENSQPPLCGWQNFQRLLPTKNWPSITICYSYTE